MYLFSPYRGEKSSYCHSCLIVKHLAFFFVILGPYFVIFKGNFVINYVIPSYSRMKYATSWRKVSRLVY